jgi:hypothetical protein
MEALRGGVSVDLQDVEAKIAAVRRELQEIGPMRPGSLSQQYTVCGKARCRCGDKINPQKHGPYYHLRYVHRGKTATIFIRKEFVPEVRVELANYKQFRKLVDRWVHLALERSRLRLEELKRSVPE